MTRVKITSEFRFPTELDMAPFMRDATGTPVRRRRLCPFSQIELNAFRRSLQTKDTGKQEYDLSGILMHAGGAHGGHYFAYIRVRCPPNLMTHSLHSLTLPSRACAGPERRLLVQVQRPRSDAGQR